MPALRRRSCPATARSPICSGRMTNPAPVRPSPVPSISRLFAAAFLAIAVAGLAERVAIWRSARRTQADMIELSQRLEQLARVSPSPALEPEIVAMRELAAEVGDNAIQAAAQTTVIFVIVLVALGVGLWYNRRRLATPFAHVVGALQRVAAGRYEERLDEDQPEEFGTIAHGVNQMAAALSWRERMQDQAGRLLSALNAPPREASAGGSRCPATSCASWWVTRSRSSTMEAPPRGPCGRSCNSPRRTSMPPGGWRSPRCAPRVGSWVCSSQPWLASSPPTRASRSSTPRRTSPLPV